MSVTNLHEVSARAKLWTVRDALIDLVATIDAGDIAPTKLVLGYTLRRSMESSRAASGWQA